MNKKVVVFDHPLITHKISLMRDKNTSSKQFRELVEEVAMLMTYEVFRDFPMKEVEVETPITTTKCKVLASDVAVVPILRAGLGLVEGVLDLFPTAKVGHIGMYRDEETLEPHEYFCKLPSDIAERNVLVVDPMMATGGSAIDAVKALKKRNCKNISFMCMIAAPEGIKTFTEMYPDVPVYCGALDEKLNENGYIVPGLGDAGDRIFGTK
ncbi:MAG: uracil phosphoribosyltransferase [Clostridia bacterium]|nr:uracil phosphoribosyltransferase [Clostridia bacterium]